jgi:hypothetical protein
MKQQEDQGLYKSQFVEGDQVILRLQNYNKTSLKANHGPYKFIKHVG